MNHQAVFSVFTTSAPPFSHMITYVGLEVSVMCPLLRVFLPSSLGADMSV